MHDGLIARRYAKALLGFASERGEEDDVYVKALSMRRICKNELFDEFVAMPVVSVEEKMAAILRIMEKENCLSSIITDFVELVVKKGRECFLPAIINSYIELYKQSKNIVDVTLITAGEADPEVPADIKALIERETGYTVNMINRIDPEIIGGFILRYDGRQIDTSVATSLRRIAKAFERKNNRIV